MVAVVRALARYLRANPLACDTADGIGRWWMGPDRVSTADLMKALDYMKRHGLMEEVFAVDGRTRYRRCASEAQLQAAIEGPDPDTATRH